jgi:hypothetical protein
VWFKPVSLPSLNSLLFLFFLFFIFNFNSIFGRRVKWPWFDHYFFSFCGQGLTITIAVICCKIGNGIENSGSWCSPRQS